MWYFFVELSFASLREFIYRGGLILEIRTRGTISSSSDSVPSSSPLSLSSAESSASSFLMFSMENSYFGSS